MRYEVGQMKDDYEAWYAEAIGPDGEVYRAIFDFCDAKQRAEEYAAWMNSRLIDNPSEN